MLDNIIQEVLLVWYSISLYITYKDTSVTNLVRFIGECVNLLMIVFILNNLFYRDNSYNSYSYFVGALLLGWFIYYTPIDASNMGYKPTWRDLYVVIDVVTIIYLVTWFAMGIVHVVDNEISLLHAFLRSQNILIGILYV